MSDPELLPSRIEIAAAPPAVRCARRWTADLLAQSGFGDLVDTAVLLVSELVTNAVRASIGAAHASSCPDPKQIDLSIARISDRIRIEVSDSAGRQFPVPTRHGADGEGGRGLQVIAALSKRWGCHTVPGGKVVWCELPTVTDAFSLAGREDPA
jgi:anti-sigma regulatory factor (Ser/Thr protein kinase)